MGAGLSPLLRSRRRGGVAIDARLAAWALITLALVSGACVARDRAAMPDRRVSDSAVNDSPVNDSPVKNQPPGAGAASPSGPPAASASTEGAASAAAAGPAAPPSTAVPETTAAPAAGKLVVHVRGCLAEAATAAGGARSPAGGGSRGMSMKPKNEVAVSREGDALLVSHKLSHACCLKVETSLLQERDAWILREQLSGQGCRCMCDSQLDYRFAAEGKSALRVETVYPTGTAQVDWSGPLPAAP